MRSFAPAGDGAARDGIFRSGASRDSSKERQNRKSKSGIKIHDSGFSSAECWTPTPERPGCKKTGSPVKDFQGASVTLSKTGKTRHG
jgi:hypothetical protein